MSDREEYQFRIPNKFAALANVDDSGVVYRAWENIRKNTKISAEWSVKGSNMGHNLMENVENSYMKESRISGAGNKIPVKLAQKKWTNRETNSSVTHNASKWK